MRTFQHWLAIPCLLLLAAAAAAGEAPDGASVVLRVGTSGDYAPFSRAVSGEDGDAAHYEGFDIAVARAYARDRGLEIEWVRFHWPKLLDDLRAGRFDVAMSGITVRPERSGVGRFTVPLVESGAVVLVLELERWRDAEGLDHPIARIGVNAGGHLERFARSRFPRATLIAVPDNEAVIRALLDGALDAAVSDTLEAPIWLARGEGMQVLGPFSRDRKAYLVHPDHPDLAEDLDAWLMAREADGALAELRRQLLGEAALAPVATPLGALLAAVDERLSLMPMVGAAKRDQGIPLEVPEREALVLDAAVAGVRQAAERRGVPAPSSAAVRALFRAQMEAAKRIQWLAVQGEDLSGPYPDVDEVLRPALLRIGDRIATLLVALPPSLEPETVRLAARAELRAPHLDTASVDAIADAISAVSAAHDASPGPPDEAENPVKRDPQQGGRL